MKIRHYCNVLAFWSSSSYKTVTSLMKLSSYSLGFMASQVEYKLLGSRLKLQ